jgi:hypothetical protein
MIELHTRLHDQSYYPIPNPLKTICTESVLMSCQGGACRIGGSRGEYLEGVMSTARHGHLCPHDIDRVVSRRPG